MARRKRLLGIAALEKGHDLLNLGVPMTRVHFELGLEGEWTYQSTVTVLNADRKGKYSVTRPPWLQEEPKLQEAPDGWSFDGVFPNGIWIQHNN